MAKAKAKPKVKGPSRKQLLELLFATYTARGMAKRYVSGPAGKLAKAGDSKQKNAQGYKSRSKGDD